MKWYEIVIVALLLPVGYYLREITYSSQTRPNRLHEDIAHLWQRLRDRSRNRKNNHKKKIL